MTPISIIRKGEAPPRLSREEFKRRFLQSFADPAFAAEQSSLDRIEAIAWAAYADGRKAPNTRKAGPGFVDPDYDLSLDWLETRERLHAATTKNADPSTGNPPISHRSEK